MNTISEAQKKAIITHLEKAQDLCAKYGLGLGNGGDIASMLSGIVSEIANGEARQIEDLAE
jgi:hypothetical protein